MGLHERHLLFKQAHAAASLTHDDGDGDDDLTADSFDASKLSITVKAIMIQSHMVQFNFTASFTGYSDSGTNITARGGCDLGALRFLRHTEPTVVALDVSEDTFPIGRLHPHHILNI